jgi:hypothetical protein
MENTEGKTIIMGMWKFDKHKVSREELIELANKWAEDESYTQLYVRGGGKNQTALGFTYMSDEKDLENEQGYYSKTYDELLKKYGIAVKGYDISNNVTQIKGF